jgi:hypothetical protein
VSTINPYPVLMMRGLASGDMHETGELWRNDGYGWELLIETKTNKRLRLNQPASGDPADASAANAEFMEVHLPYDTPARIGDYLKQDELRWLIGLTNKEDSFQTFTRCYATRPIAATPRSWVTFIRYDPSTGLYSPQSPQLVQVAWSKNQPDRLGGVSVRQYGWIFAVEEDPIGLNIRQGDTFAYGGMAAVVTWVPPDPTQRREAIFSVNIGEGT